MAVAASSMLIAAPPATFLRGERIGHLLLMCEFTSFLAFESAATFAFFSSRFFDFLSG